VATELGIADAASKKPLANFPGIDRRLQQLGASSGGRPPRYVDDYGHHPTEVPRPLDAVRQGWPERRLVWRFNRSLFSHAGSLDDFARVLGDRLRCDCW